jgi:glycosyltransferase involved in cell wall biosynthesis
MKILVFEKRLDLGGTQVNAIELAARVRDRYRHDMIFCAPPGPLAGLVRDKGLKYVPAPQADRRLSLARIRALNSLIRSERPDIVHAWDWSQCFDAYYVAHILYRLPMVVTCMSMCVDRLLPPSLPTTYGTPDLVRQARVMGCKRLKLLLPPVDVVLNAPGAVDARPFRERLAIGEKELVIVTVSRLAQSMKADSIERTIRVVAELAAKLPVTLVVVGEGDGRVALSRQAECANSALGREVIKFAGPLVDPRPAYEAADVVVGMGGSSLRGMAFAKPVVVVGEGGFAKLFCPETADHFYEHGLFGIGDGDPGNAELHAALLRLAVDRDVRASLGSFSRDFVSKYYSLDQMTARLSEVYEQAAMQGFDLVQSVFEGARMAAIRYAGSVLPRALREDKGREMPKSATTRATG